jgi:DMSO/TMAO reductase YedYZ heme-binding membrane subunit
VAVEITSLLRRRLSKRVWRATHFLSFPLFALTTIHALSAGTDAGNVVWRGIVAAVVVAVTALTFIRVQGSRTGTLPPRVPPRVPPREQAPPDRELVLSR